MAWIIRQQEWWVRCPLLWVLYPICNVPLIVTCLFNGRAYQFEFWDNLWWIFWAAHDGYFVEGK